MFTVSAIESPSSQPETIGTIVLTSELSTSKFGDEALFFKHQRMEDDFDLKPDWLASIDRKVACGMDCVGTKKPTIEKGCSSPFNNTHVQGMMSTDSVTV